VEVTEEQLQAMVDRAVQDAMAARTQQLVEQAVQAKNDEIQERVLEATRAKAMSDAASVDVRMEVDSGTGYQYALINLDLIDYNRLSRRTEEELDPNSISVKKLAKDIEVQGGIIRPLLVYRQNGRYILVKGHRRLAALRSLNEEVTRAYILPAKPPIGDEEQWVNGY